MIEECNLEMKQLFFNNLQLLGFDVVAMEATNHIPFNKNMFELPNKRGAEIVLHFLFERLNPTMCREAFRDVWPILDKKREQAFRKTCASWLSNIARDEPTSDLPRINASLFMSPGGDKFYDLLMCFSGHVLMKVIDSELVCLYSKPVERLALPALTPSNVHLGDVIVKGLTCSSIRPLKSYFDICQLTIKAGKTWKETTDEYVKEYRKHNKEIRELDYDIREEEQRSVENSINRGSPTKKYGKLDNLDPTYDPRIIQRAQRVQHVREMWKQLDDFERTESAEREIVESIVERTINKYKIDVFDIGVQVPDMLLRECGDEIRRRNVANTYQGGKLNLESVLQLWNLCLHLYLEKLKQVGMPQFNDDVKKLTSQVHVQQNYLQSARTLRNQMTEKIPVLKDSIEKLREGLDDNMFKDKTPTSIRSTSVGFGLVEPSPQPNFSPSAVVTPAQPLEVPRSPGYVETPEAADRIRDEMRASINLGPKQLFAGDVDLLSQHGPKESAIPRPGSSKGPSQASSRQSSRPTSARSTASTKGSKRSNQSTTKSTQNRFNTQDREAVFPTVSSPRTMAERSYKDSERLDQSIDSIPLSARSNLSTSMRSDRSNKSGNSSSTAKASQSPRSLKSDSSGRLSARSHGSEGQAQQQDRKTTADLLVDEIMGEGKILSPFNSGVEAFESRVLVNRTPEFQEDNKENVGPEEEIDNYYNNTGISGETNYATDNEHIVDRKERNFSLSKARVTPLSIETANMMEQPIDIEDNSNNANVNNYTDTNQRYGFDAVDQPEDNSPEDKLDNDVNTSVRYDADVDANELDEDQMDVNDIYTDKGNRSNDYTGGGVEFEEILGPELDEEYDNDDYLSEGSHRSEGQVVVIDRSLRLSPKRTPDKQQRIEDTKFIEDEQFPSLETSPREAIVIDHSFHRSPASDHQRNRNHSNNIPDFMSQSYQGEAVNREQVKKDLLSKSLILDSSPLIEDIRQMFQKAVAETPPRGQSASSTFQREVNSGIGGRNSLRRQIDVASPQTEGYGDRIEDVDLLDLPDMDINSRQWEPSSGIRQRGDTSLDMTENLNDIQMPDFDEYLGVDGDIDDSNNIENDDYIDSPANDGDTSNNFDESDKDKDTEKKQDFTIPGVVEIDDIDEFFSTKTPEFPSRSQGRIPRSPVAGGRDFASKDGSSFEMPEFPDESLEEDLPLISFTS